MTKDTILASNEWLGSLPETAREELIKAAKVQRYHAGQRVQGKGEAADGLYGLLSGEVRVRASTYGGHEIVFTRLFPGNWFGEIAILDGGLRTHDAHATVESQLAILPKRPLLALCDQFPAVYRALVSLLCTHCRMAFSAVDDFLVYSPEQRLANRLLLAAEVPRKRISMSQEELGALIGVSRQSINKILRKWEQRGWILRGYRALEVMDVDSLRRLVALS